MIFLRNTDLVKQLVIIYYLDILFGYCKHYRSDLYLNSKYIILISL